MRRTCSLLGVIAVIAVTAVTAAAQPAPGCKELPPHAELKKALAAAQAESNGGLGFHMWGTVVDRDGVVCAVVHTGADRGEHPRPPGLRRGRGGRDPDS